MCIHIQARLVRRHRAEAVLLRPALSRDEEEVVRRAAHESTAISTNCPECTSVVHPCLETQRDTVLCLFIRCGHSSTFANPLWIEVDPRCLYPRCLNDPAEIRGTLVKSLRVISWTTATCAWPGIRTALATDSVVVVQGTHSVRICRVRASSTHRDPVMRVVHLTRPSACVRDRQPCVHPVKHPWIPTPSSRTTEPKPRTVLSSPYTSLHRQIRIQARRARNIHRPQYFTLILQTFIFLTRDGYMRP